DVTTLVKAMAPSLHSNHHRPAAQALAKLLATCRNRNAHATHGHLGPIDFPRALPPLGASFDVASGGNYCLGVGKEVGCGPCYYMHPAYALEICGLDDDRYARPLGNDQGSGDGQVNLLEELVQGNRFASAGGSVAGSADSVTLTWSRSTYLPDRG